MAKPTLIIVESPTKARTLTRFLGSAYKIEASMGHVRDLPTKKLGIDVNESFEPQYEIPKEKKETANRLRRSAQAAGKVILATDPDREGEAIAWHVKEILTKARAKKDKVPENIISRMVFHEITKSAIEDAIKHPRDIDANLVDAQQGRRVLDRLVGYKLSPLLWYKTGKNWLSAGRVQSIAVRLIVEREREIKAFIPVEFWEISARLRAVVSSKSSVVSDSAQDFVAKLSKINDKTAEVTNGDQAKNIVADLEKAQYKVASVKTSEIRRKPYPPFITSTLQRAASTLFGWSARKTMTIAQNLYEEGLITYHRTDSVQLSKEAVAMGREFIEKKYGKEYLPDTPNIYKTSAKVAQEAHEAIRPAHLGGAQKEIGKDHSRLLDLITKRFLGSQMKEQLMERISIEVAAIPKSGHPDPSSDGEGSIKSNHIDSSPAERVQNDNIYTLRASGDRQVFAGWRAVYGGTSDSGQEEKLNPMPKVSEGEALDLLKLISDQKFTQPPARYNEASLIKALEEQGIGRPSTYAPTISTIQARQYVEKNDSRAFVPSELGEMVNDFLVEHFGDVINIGFTRDMEDKLDAVAKGEHKWTDTIKLFWKTFEADILKTRQNVERVKLPEKKTGEICPDDGGELVERVGRYGKFLACGNFPNCKFTKPIVQTIDVKCPTCGGDVVIKKTKKGRKFFGCSNYPKCNFASWQKPQTTAKSPSPAPAPVVG